MRNGIISIGTWLADIVQFIDKYPLAGNLVTIQRIEKGLGGCAHNVLMNLAKMNTHLKLYAGGCVGNDEYGNWIIRELNDNGIDSTQMLQLPDVPTSYTNVMSEINGSTRTFFHYRGANACLGPEHFAGINIPAKIFHVGYLLLLDRLDIEDAEYGVTTARVLDGLQKKGYKTSVDVVSEESDRFRKIILPCLPYIDYFIVNEVEAGACFGEPLRDAKGSICLEKVKEAASFLLDSGVKDTCVIHFPEGGYGINRKGESHYEPSLMLSSAEIVSTVGAGDAFCAGMLYALYEEMELPAALRFANTSARFNLRHATCTGGAPTLQEINEFITSNY